LLEFITEPENQPTLTGLKNYFVLCLFYFKYFYWTDSVFTSDSLRTSFNILTSVSHPLFTFIFIAFHWVILKLCSVHQPTLVYIHSKLVLVLVD